MHELSIVNSLIELCEQNLQANNAKSIKEVHVKIGRLSGIEIELFQRTFETFKQGSSCENAELFIQIAQVSAQCRDCDFMGELTENVFYCPKCKSGNLEVKDGEDMYLMRLVME